MWRLTIETDVATAAWRRRLHAAHAAHVVRVHSFMPLDAGQAMEEFEVIGPDAGLLAQDARREGAEVIEAAGERARLRRRTHDLTLLEAVRASGIVPAYPIEGRDGRERLTLVGERIALARFVATLERQGVRTRIVELRRHRPRDALTPRQGELIRAAIEQGYYDVPRRVSLTRLAQRLGVAKSTLSEALARGERRVLLAGGLALA